jgi:hypothetical protein
MVCSLSLSSLRIDSRRVFGSRMATAPARASGSRSARRGTCHPAGHSLRPARLALAETAAGPLAARTGGRHTCGASDQGTIRAVGAVPQDTIDFYRSQRRSQRRGHEANSTDPTRSASGSSGIGSPSANIPSMCSSIASRAFVSAESSWSPCPSRPGCAGPSTSYPACCLSSCRTIVRRLTGPLLTRGNDVAPDRVAPHQVTEGRWANLQPCLFLFSGKQPVVGYVVCLLAVRGDCESMRSRMLPNR